MADEKQTPLPPELVQLQAEAEQITAETVAPPPPAEGEQGAPAAPVDYLADARGLVDMSAELLAAFYPSTRPVLDDAARGRIAAAASPVMEKYGLSLGGLFGKWGAEINLAFVLAQVALPLSAAIRADREAKAESAPVAAAAAAVEATAPKSEPGGDLYAKA